MHEGRENDSDHHRSSSHKKPAGHRLPVSYILIGCGALMSIILLNYARSIVSTEPTLPPTAHNLQMATSFCKITGTSNTMEGTGRLHVVPVGGMCNRLRAVASGLTAGRVLGDVKVTFKPNPRDGYFIGDWGNYFSAPKLVFEDIDGMNADTCPMLSKPSDLMKDELVGAWVDKGCRTAVCVSSLTHFMVLNQWFYKALQPSAKLQTIISEFQDKHDWYKWGTWIGIHLRRTELGIRVRNVSGDGEMIEILAKDTIKVEWYCDMALRVAKLCKDKPRFVVASDDPEDEQTLFKQMNKAGYSPENKNFIAYPKATRDKLKDVYQTRTTQAGIEEAVIDLFLLSKAKALIGTTKSTYTETVGLIGSLPTITVKTDIADTERKYAQEEAAFRTALSS